ncbi:MAG: TetR family transcriptional regulator [Alphaproteobacteria bacterium]|nr:TetR family transcriptional regulator [Alphaproteobacteria bacterium]
MHLGSSAQNHVGRAKKPRPNDYDSDHARRLREIVKSAADLFLDRGYHNVSMEDIAARVGLRKPTLYHYVKSKVDILTIISHEYMGVAFADQTASLGRRLSPAERLLEFMTGILAAVETHRGHMKVLFEYNRELPPRERKAIQQEKERFQALLEQVIKSGVTSGEFRQVPTTLVTLGILGMCVWAYQWYQGSGARSPRQVAELYLDLLINGLKADSHAGLSPLGR